MTRTIKVVMVVVVVAAGLSLRAVASDWPQWLGPDRNGVSKETGLLKSWPEGGPKLLWKATNLGEAHATPSVAAGKVYGMGLRGSDEVVWCLDDKSGKELWATKIADGITLGGAQGGYGPRSTPTVEDGRLYTLGVGGDLACLDSQTGKKIWQKSFTKEFGADVPQWGFSESPLVDGNNVIAAPGSRAATVVAFNKATGEVVWECLTPEQDEAHYTSAIVANVNGQKQIIHFLKGGVIGISSTDGKFLWRYAHPANRIATCPTPIYRDGFVFAASGYNTGGGQAKLTAGPSGTTATETYFTRNMTNHHGGYVLVGDYLYGFDDRNRGLVCLDWKTGDMKWTNPSVGKGSIAAADGMLVVRSEGAGTIGLVQATPDGYKEISRFDQPERSRAPAWPHPVVANGKLYIRDMNNLFCFDIKAK